MKTLPRNAAGNTELKQLARTLGHHDRPLLRIASLVLIIAAVVVATACGHAMMMDRGTEATYPAAGAFGAGPRSSASRPHVATLAVGWWNITLTVTSERQALRAN